MTYCLKENEAGKNVQAHYFSNKNKIMAQKEMQGARGTELGAWSVEQGSGQ
jgi:hypothetical protein